ncbi:cyclic nucleotide-binding domain-containing protein [Piscinibacter sp.]|uniref:cyclic nucleotide-binding domain-containing protein n=1 Tax=Piscinibacter sp. TaxID=1903157 RepID=UPI002C925253|nr:cyclic nucleotide-binding domain-containing protein [Albitalea sp.]HUG26256.1 cyclic nucleotide-binding domain-containing protein [Albitalea sp.]
MTADESLGILRGVAPFDRLPADALQRLAAGLTEAKAVPGQAIVREGDAGDRMFFVASGSVQVLGRSFDGSEIVLARLEPRAYFGEQALLAGSGARRNATVRALTHCRLLVLTRDGLLSVLEPGSAFAQRLGATAREHDELRAGRLREGVLRKLGGVESYRIETFAAGAYVFHQGDPADRLYLVLEGRARVSSGAAGAEADLTELLPGQMFGERAILRDQPRTASVRAFGELKVASLDAAWFRGHLADSPQLQSIMQSLDGMYMLPRRGLLTLQTGQLAAHPTLTAIHDLPDGRRVISTRLVGRPTFTSRVVDAPEPDFSARFEDPDTGAVREVHLVDGVPVELESSGEWRGLGEAFEGLLDAHRLDDAQLARFEACGSFDSADDGGSGARRRGGVVCACASASVDDIRRAIDAGCHTADQVAQRTRATLVCGGCLPTVREMLGVADWTPARCTSIVALGERVRAFRLQPLDRGVAPFQPGQHLVVQGRIGEHWVQRAYTISSAPGSGDAYEITVQREPEGVFSRWLFERSPGDALLRVSPAGGSYHLPADGPVDAVCLVGGIGVTPALSMARSLALAPGRGRLHIDHSVSELAQAVALDELRELAARHPQISCRVRATRTQGRLDAAEVLALVQARPVATFYLCGSVGYMAAMAAHLAAAGVAPERVRQEQFRVAGERPSAEMLA